MDRLRVNRLPRPSDGSGHWWISLSLPDDRYVHSILDTGASYPDQTLQAITKGISPNQLMDTFRLGQPPASTSSTVVLQFVHYSARTEVAEDGTHSASSPSSISFSSSPPTRRHRQLLTPHKSSTLKERLCQCLPDPRTLLWY